MRPPYAPIFIENFSFWVKICLGLFRFYKVIWKKLEIIPINFVFQNDEGEQDQKKGTQLLEIYALEIQMYTEQKNNKVVWEREFHLPIFLFTGSGSHLQPGNERDRLQICHSSSSHSGSYQRCVCLEVAIFVKEKCQISQRCNMTKLYVDRRVGEALLFLKIFIFCCWNFEKNSESRRWNILDFIS